MLVELVDVVDVDEVVEYSTSVQSDSTPDEHPPPVQQPPEHAGLAPLQYQYQ
jgi:hypothetical protein